MAKTRYEIISKIAADLLDHDVLNLSDFDDDVDAVVSLTETIIESNLEDYMIIIGNAI